MEEAPDLDRLHAELIDMRRRLVTRLVKRMEGGDLALLGSVNGALDAVEQMRTEVPDAVR
jgi:hypothetical protein